MDLNFFNVDSFLTGNIAIAVVGFVAMIMFSFLAVCILYADRTACEVAGWTQLFFWYA